MAMTVRLKDVKHLVNIGYAEDITMLEFIEDLRQKESGFKEIAISTGYYGVNGVVVQGNISNKLYAITSRSTNLFHVL